jgi:hypothetical protein
MVTPMHQSTQGTVSFRALPAATKVIQLVFHNLGPLTRMSWPWILIVMAALVLLIFVMFYLLLQGQSDIELSVGPLLGAGGAYIALALLAFSAVAVMFHRYFLRGEITSGLARLRLDSSVWRYTGNLLLLALIGLTMLVLAFVVAAPAVFSLFGMAGVDLSQLLISYPLLAFLISAAISVFFTYILTRLSIKLPAIALRRSNYGLGAALYDSKGNTFQIVLFVVLINVIVYVFQNVLGLALTPLANQGMIGSVIALLIQAFFSCIGFAIGIVALTVLYGVFAEGREI